MKKYEKNYLRIYANIGKAEYSEEEKKVMTELLIGIANNIFSHNELKYDISGSGYGISKGDGLIGEKSLKNKIDKKGYMNLFGLKVCSGDRSYKSGFFILPSAIDLKIMDIYFSWTYTNEESLQKANEIIKLISQKLKIAYAYAYSDDKTLLENGEGRITYGIFSIKVIIPEQERKWESKLHEIPSGTIKKLYPFNVFNKKQLEGLSGIHPEKQIDLSNGNQIWIFDPSKLNEENNNVKTKVID
jgi:hypothetical protein